MVKMKLRIGNRLIGENEPVYIVAEIGKNYNGDLNIARELIRKAAFFGADAVKFQSFRAKTVIRKETDKYAHVKESAYGMHKRLELSKSDHEELFEYAKKFQIEWFSTPEDLNRVDLLDKLGVRMFKIASLDLTHYDLLKKIASKGKPIFMSTGMATLQEISKAVSIITKINNKLAILHCVSNYPPKDENVDLNFIQCLREKYSHPIGYSDHTIGIEAPIAAVALGAKIIEKHITLDKLMEGPDHKLAADIKEFEEMVKGIRRIEKMVGCYYKTISQDELEMRSVVKRKIVAKKNIPRGTVLTKNLIEAKISKEGVGIQNLEKFLGKKLKRAIKEDQPILLGDVK